MYTKWRKQDDLRPCDIQHSANSLILLFFHSLIVILELYHAESWELLARRWTKLEKDFLNVKTSTFNISKVPDIYDCIKYDLLHNKSVFECSEAEELYTYAKNMADVVVPQVMGGAATIYLPP